MTGQNTSHAVMQQRSEAKDSFDDFPTPMWATRAMLEFLRETLGYDIAAQIVKEPCANRGYMVAPLVEAFAKVLAADVFDYGAGFAVEDYLFGDPDERVDWTVCNPPFVLAERFIDRAITCSTKGVAVFVRTSFLEGMDRFRNLYAIKPPSLILQFSERVIIHKGIVRDPAVKYWNPKAAKGKGAWQLPSSATSYCWLIWDKSRVVGVDQDRTAFEWIGPSRKRLERQGDYNPLGIAA